MKKHILVALIASLVLLGAVGSVSADDPIQNLNVLTNGVQPQDACPFWTSCSYNGYAYWVQNTNSGGTGILGHHSNSAGTAPGVYGYTNSTTASSYAVLGISGPTAPGSNATGVRGMSNGTGGTGIGGWFTQNGSGWGAYAYTPSGISLFGNTGSGIGAYGASGTGTGVYGYHSATTGTSAGVYGYSRSTAANAPGILGVIGSNTPGGNSAGVRGINYGTGGAGIGGWFSQSGSGYGVYGSAPNGIGVYGSSNNIGVLGYHTASSGTAPGVYGYTASTAASAIGVLGYSGPTAPGSNSTGVRGISNGTGSTGIGGWFSQNGSGWGVYASTPKGTSVYGSTSSGTGVYGVSGSGTGVYGFHTATSGSSPGVLGYSRTTTPYAYAILGNAVATNPGSYVTGVRGHSSGTAGDGIGVWGSHAARGWGVLGSVADTVNGYAGVFFGRVSVIGTLYKTAGSFKIDHPLDPANKFLQHSFVESPDMMNVYNGNVVLDENGEAWVSLPDYFEALNSDFRYQLSAIGAPAPRLFIASEVSNNRFQISGGRAGQKVSWQVTGIRQDAYAKAHRIEVEVDKTEQERGFYLIPDLFGASADKDLTWHMQGAAQAPNMTQLSVGPEMDSANEAVLGGTAGLPDLSANTELIEQSVEELYPVPELEQEPSTSTTAEGVAAP